MYSRLSSGSAIKSLAKDASSVASDNGVLLALFLLRIASFKTLCNTHRVMQHPQICNTPVPMLEKIRNDCDFL